MRLTGGSHAAPGRQGRRHECGPLIFLRMHPPPLHQDPAQYGACPEGQRTADPTRGGPGRLNALGGTPGDAELLATQKKWEVYTRFQGRKLHLGFFEANEEAEAARVADGALLIIHDGFVRDPSR